MMRKAIWVIAATLIGAGTIATPSLAQVQLGVSPNGPSIRIGPDDHRYERRYIERRRVYDDDRLTTGSVRGCRTVVIREENDDGDMVTRRIRRCR
ncbi:hypothetical protein [Microvirga puerhi]|uniref:Secreted protein n=1 Tax=Microvirga puerhi TaxID=2876078 RepID=A0ABS7VJV8_9HYPH|nr:hypothetical protein [Microvirga puerhi]MBZ6075814.1 hypothetical protein [Microvirga puerhi]